MPGTVTSTRNSYVSTTASGSLNNTDNHAFQATLDLIVNNMASIQTQLNHVIDMQNISTITADQHGKQSKSSQPGMSAPVPGVYSFCDQPNTQHNMVQAVEQAPQGMHISSLYNMSGSSSISNNVYDSVSRSSNSLPNLGGSVPGLQSTVGLTEYSSVHNFPGILDKTIHSRVSMCVWMNYY